MNGLIKSEATRGRGGGTKGEWQEMAEIWDFFRVPKGSTAELPTKAGKRTEQIIIQRAQVELRAGEWVLGFVFCVGKAPSYVQFRDGQVTAYLSCKLIGNFSVSRHRFTMACSRVAPQGMLAALSFQIAPLFAKAPQESASFHWTITTSRIASRGIPRRASSRRSSRISDMASARL